MNQINKCLPEKNIKITSDDSPWCNDKIKHLKRLKCREYRKHSKSDKWIKMHEKYQTVIKQEKQKHYNKVIKDLKQSDPNQWYSKLKRLCSYDLEKHEVLKCEELNQFDDQIQADTIVKHFSKVRRRFDDLKSYDIETPHFEETSVPHFSQFQVEEALKRIKTKTSVPPGDIPPKILKLFEKLLFKTSRKHIELFHKTGKMANSLEKRSCDTSGKNISTKTSEKSSEHK